MVAPAEFHSLSPFPFYGFPRPPLTNYVGLTDYEDAKMLVGIDRYFESERRDWRLHKFIKNIWSSPDTRTILPDQLF